MKKAVKHKLKSQGGDSLLTALLYFLAAMMVGAVVLTAAATNAGRLARNRQEQQNYLAVASAARLVARDIQNAAFSAGYTETTTRTTVTAVDKDGKPVEPQPAAPADTTEYAEIPASLSGSTLLTGKPKSEMANLFFSTVSEFHRIAPTEMKYALTFTADLLPEVSGLMDIDTATHTITVTLYIEKDGEKLNATVLTFAAQVADSDSTTEEETTTTVETPADPTAVPPTEAISTTTTIKTITTTYTTTVTWTGPVITKGASS